MQGAFSLSFRATAVCWSSALGVVLCLAGQASEARAQDTKAGPSPPAAARAAPPGGLAAAERRAKAVEKRSGPGSAATAEALHAWARMLMAEDRAAEAQDILRRVVAIREKVLAAPHDLTALAWHDLADALLAAGRPEDAAGAYAEALKLRERLDGPGALSTAAVQHALGTLLHNSAKSREGIALLEPAAATRGAVLGEHAATADTHHILAQAYFVIGQMDRAVASAERALAIREQVLPPDAYDLALTLHVRALLHLMRNEVAPGEAMARRSLAVKAMSMPQDDPRMTDSHELLAMLSEMQGRYADALEAFQRGLAIRRAALGREDAAALRFMHAIARVQAYLGRYIESEAAYREVLATHDRLYGPDAGDVSDALIGLADAYSRQGRLSESEPLYRRALQQRERAHGKDHFVVAVASLRLGRQFAQLGRYAEAEELYRRAIAINEKTYGAEHFFTSISLADLADLQQRQGRIAEAEPLYRRAIAIQERQLGPDHPALAHTIGALAHAIAQAGRLAEAEPLRRRQLAMLRAANGPEHDLTAAAHANVGLLLMSSQRWAEAAESYAAATDIYISRSRRNLGSLVSGALRAREGEIGRNSWTFLNHVRALYWSQEGRPDEASARRAFELVQWAGLSDAADALTRMAARTASSDGDLARLVREHQDLIGEWRALDVQLGQAMAGGQGGGAATPVVARERLGRLEARISDIGGELRRRFPEYVELSSPRPAAAAALQALLGEREVLLQYSLTAADSFVWVVWREGIAWRRLPENERDITARISAIRGALETGAHFDLGVAYDLYRAVLAPIEPLIRDKSLLIVTSGALATLPFQALVTRLQESDLHEAPRRYRRAAWLANTHAVTILPSASALPALRRHARRSTATKAFLGFGNPLLLGRTGADRSAWAVGPCMPATARRRDGQEDPPKPIASIAMAGRDGLERYFRGGTANLAALRELEPLPETATEVCDVAASLGGAASDVLLGASATEASVKQMSREGKLAAARILHFATHGLVAGEIRGLAEPGLVLTPPADDADRASLSEDDGLLTASEIATLKLDADWVILSACNTAAGSERGGEALSGLARAFFYAQARSMLVSHWAVTSGSTVRLIIDAVGAASAEPAIGRAEALRRAMLKMIASGRPHESHPSYWAPFIVVGEGGGLQ